VTIEKRILKAGAFSSPVDVTEEDEICLGSNRAVRVHSERLPSAFEATRWAVVQLGKSCAYVVGGETLHKDLQKDGFDLDFEIKISPRRKR
jgi:hypothetical protein